MVEWPERRHVADMYQFIQRSCDFPTGQWISIVLKPARLHVS